MTFFQRTSGWNGPRDKIQLASKKEGTVVVRAHMAGLKNQTGYGRSNASPNAQDPHQAI
jgi:hypothetical protein